jgi:hypothetical protein
MHSLWVDLATHAFPRDQQMSMPRFGLARTESASGFTVTHETALGATTHYGVERPGGEAEVRRVTDPAGLVTTRARDRAFVTTTTVPSGMRSVATAS